MLMTVINFILKHRHFENLFHYTNNLRQNIKFTMEKENNKKEASLGTLVKHNNEKISVLVYRKAMHTEHYTFHHKTGLIVFPLSLIEHISLSP